MKEGEDLNTELTSLENQVATLQAALDEKTSSEMSNEDVEQAREQIDDLFGEDE